MQSGRVSRTLLSVLALWAALTIPIGSALSQQQLTDWQALTSVAGADGANPYAGVIRDSAGNLYGTTRDGGASNAGVVFKVDTTGQETVLYTFTGGADGSNPYAGVILDSAGNLYGTTFLGGTTGYGVVFKLDATGQETVLHSFTGAADGAYPRGGVIQDSAGNLYGAAYLGGASSAGVVFKLDTTGNYTVLYTFTGGADGYSPYAGVVLDSAGNLYGTTSGGGASKDGVIFKVDTTGHETVLYSFTGGAGGYGGSGVIQDSSGNLYGTTSFGGASGGGGVFKLDTAGQYTLRYSFTGGADGGSPGGVILDPAGNLYGTTSSGGASNVGVVFKVDTTGHETVLYSFTGGADGGSPNAGVIGDGAGNLYGTTLNGGASGYGVVFKLDPAGNETVLHSFKTQYQLTISASPAAGGTVTPAGGGLYNSGTLVPISATVNSGYSFTGWSGSVASPGSASTTVTMNAPQTVTANFTAFTAVTINTSPAGLQVIVDGSTLTAPQTLNCSPGSYHSLSVNSPQGSGGTQSVFTNWSDGGSQSHTITCPSFATTFTAGFQTQYQLTTSASPAAGGTVTPAGGGLYNSGTVVPISATANSGYSFTGWSGSVASPGSASTTVTMNAPQTVTANFTASTAVTINTSPAGLQVIVDGSTLTAPQTLNCSPGSYHSLSVNSPQGSGGTQSVFTNWSDGGSQSHTITCPSFATTFTAGFQTQYQLTISASPAAGGTVTPAGGGLYNSGTVVPISATANSGYSFTGWSGSVASPGSASTTVTMNAPQTVTANFTTLTVVTINTSPAGLQVVVDGSTLTAPQTLNCSPGSNHSLGVNSPQVSGGTQSVFTSWSDGGSQSHTITCPSSATTFTAGFKTQYQLTISASPTIGGTVTPVSGGFYDSGTAVPISATANNGYSFASWSGSVASPGSASTTVTMNAPQTVTANFTVLAAHYLLFTSISPPGSGIISASPSSSDGYAVGTSVQLTAIPNTGYRFIGWTGDLAGTTNPQSLTMNASRSVTAVFAGNCTFTLSAGAATLGSSGGNGSVNVTAPGGCTWTASSPVSWIVNANGAGSGSGTVSYTIQANSGSVRNAILMIAGQPFTINQTDGCIFGLSPATAAPAAAGGSGQFTVGASGPSCTWTASSNAPWLNVTGGASGSGNGAVNYSVAQNSAATSRTASITINGQTSVTTFTLVQGGACSYSLQQASQAFDDIGGDGTATVLAPGGCPWTATSSNTSFVTITTGAGVGDGSVAYSVAANTGAARTATLTIAGLTYTVAQAAIGATTPGCTVSAPAAPEVALEGRTEVLGELVLVCSGPLTADITLRLNTNVTNGLQADGSTTDAALSVNSGATVNGRISGYNTIGWAGVAWPSSGATIRISKVRADASLLSLSAGLQSASITGQVIVSTTAPVPVANSTQTLANALPSMVFRKDPPASVGSQTTIGLHYEEAFSAAFQAAATRLRLVVANVPGTVQVYAPVYPTEGASLAQLYSADGNGAGGSPLAGNPLNGTLYQQLLPGGGTATATWLVLAADPTQLETLTFPLVIIGASTNDLNQIQVTASLAPISAVSVASANAPVPRYRDFSVPQQLVNLRISTMLPAARAAASLASRAVTVGSNVTFVTTLVNDTSDPSQTATNVVIRDSLPSGLNYVSCTASGGASCSVSGGQVQVNYGTLGPGQAQTVMVLAQVDPSVADGTIIENPVSASSDEAECGFVGQHGECQLYSAGRIARGRGRISGLGKREQPEFPVPVFGPRGIPESRRGERTDQ